MKEISGNIKNTNFVTLNRIEEKNLVIKLRGHLSDVHSKFKQSKIDINQMYDDFKKQQLAENKRLEDKKRRLRSVANDVKANSRQVSSLRDQKTRLGYDLEEAEKERSSARSAAKSAERAYSKARKEEKHWKMV